LDLGGLRLLTQAAYDDFSTRGYFQESMGLTCVDDGRIPGTMGKDPAQFAFIRLRKHGLFPPKESSRLSEEDLFDLIEFLSDHVSKPTKGREHDWNNCGWHWQEFDRDAGKAEFEQTVNEFLGDYGDGWVLSPKGEVLRRGPDDLSPLLESELPPNDEQNVGSRVKAAVLKYRRHASSSDDRKDAVRDLAAVLEYMRPSAKAVLTRADEGDLFDLANSFGIRHHRPDQKVNYDEEVWLPWMFYYYLATIHALLRIISRGDSRPYTG
jgi:hypothetical protein